MDIGNIGSVFCQFILQLVDSSGGPRLSIKQSLVYEHAIQSSFLHMECLFE
uniref:Uncharacterized protein n=1 Tax=Nelumbo nucifera TaxID=4432 RepID=A0A822XK88_NELNU|nr:TPA_asm: hypothetical protein HUJ06_021014 [Nelumbo nucifera]